MIIKTYTQLNKYLKAFKKGSIHLLVVNSEGGLGKSRGTKNLLPNALFFGGHATPLKIYLELYHNPDKLVVFDDTDTLTENKVNVSLLKQACETEHTKTIRYATTAKINEENVEKEFQSQNKVLLLTNNIAKSGYHMKALMTRGIYIDFKPTNQEILRKLKEYAKDTEILKYLEDHIDELKLNLRVYDKCKELKRAGLNYQNYLMSEYRFIDEHILVKQLSEMEDIEERDRIWYNKTGKSVRTLQRKIKTTNDTTNDK